MKTIFIAIFLCIFPSWIHAQWSLSAMAGIQQSFAGKYNMPQYSSPGYQAGIRLEVPVKAGFGFESGMLYQKKIMMFRREELPSPSGLRNSVSEFRYSSDLHQLSIPLIAGYTFRSGEEHSWCIQAGMHYSFSLAAYNVYQESVMIEGEPRYSYQNKTYFKRSFSAEFTQNLIIDDRPVVNLFIPSFYAGLSWRYQDKYSIHLFYERDLYNYYLKNNDMMSLDNLQWQTVGLLFAYSIFRV